MNVAPCLQQLEQAQPVDVLIWARIRAKKRGSFEAYLLAMVQRCKAQGLSVAIVVGQETQAELLEMMAQAGVFIHEMPTECWDSPTVLKRVLAAFRPRIVHFHFYSVVSILWPVVRRFGALAYLSAHNSLPEPSSDSNQKPLLERVRKLRRLYFARKIDRFLPVSAFLAEDLRTTSCVHESSITMIPNGVDCERFSPVTVDERRLLRQQLSLHPDKPVIAFVGQIERHKGIVDFCQAMQSMSDERDFQVVIAGEGAEFSSLRERYPQWRWLGSVDSVEQVLRASDILVCPSRWQEAFGLVIAEALACGVPVVASDRGGIPEVISNNETGYLIPAANPEVMRQRISDLLEDSDLRERMGRAARARAISLFSLSEQVERTVDLYQQDLAVVA